MAWAGVLAVLTCAGHTRAEDFTFTYSSDLTAARGVLSGMANSGGSYSILSGVLVVEAGAAVGTYDLVPGGGEAAPFYSASGFFIVDNVLSPSRPSEVLSWYGLLFARDGAEVNIWGNGAGSLDTFYKHGGGDYSENGRFVVTQVPAPAAMAVMGLGGAIFGLRRRR